MGYILRYTCSNCKRIDGLIYYGVGMRSLERNEDYRLFGCNYCGDVFSRNINKNFNRCPNCKRKAKELVFFNTIEHFFDDIPLKRVQCPNCANGNIQLHNLGMWD